MEYGHIKNGQTYLMRLLLTRPISQAVSMARTLRQRGHAVDFAPMLRVVRLQFDPAPIEAASAIVITSANAVPGLEAMDLGRHRRIFAVGPDTAAALERAGFTDIVFAGGTAVHLIDVVVSQWRLEDGALAYASGKNVSVDISARLASRGFQCERVAVYSAEPTPELPRKVAGVLADGHVDAILFMSVRSAENFVFIASRSSVAHACRSTVAVSLSKNIADTLVPITWKDSVSAASPTRAGMLSAIDSIDAG